MMKINVTLSILLIYSISLSAQIYTIDECRQLALQNNKKVQIAAEELEAAKDAKRATVASFFPKVSANGGYLWNEKNLVLLPDQLGTGLGVISAGGGVSWANQTVAQMFPTISGTIGQAIGGAYGTIRDRLTLDVHNIFAGQVGVTQPIFLGGKIVNTYKIADAAEHIAEMRADENSQDVVLKVEEAYWRVVSVQKKVFLAKQYYDLIARLDSDVTALAEEGMATHADMLKVKIKLSEAEQKLGQAEDGLVLSRMALCQLCGLKQDYPILVDTAAINNVSLAIDTLSIDDILSRRGEIQILEESEKIAHSAVMLSASTLMPNIVAQANYVVTNPGLQNGFKKDFQGQFCAGVVVNVPIAHADDIYRLKAAKHGAKVVDLKLAEARELIELQATQSRQKVSDAQRKLARSITALDHSKEILRLAQESWQEGLVSSTELLGAQTAWMSAETDRLDAAIELKMAELTYAKHSGTMKY